MEEAMMVDIIHESLRRRGILAHLKANVWKEIEKGPRQQQLSDGCDEEMKLVVKDIMLQPSLNVLLKNAIYQEKLRLSQNELEANIHQPLDYIEQAYQNMKDKLITSLTALSTLTTIPFCQERNKSESDKLQKKWNSIGSFKYDHSKLTAIYTHKDMLEFLCLLKNPNIRSLQKFETTGRLIQLYFSSNNLTNLKQQYSSLHPSKLEVSLVHSKSNRVLKSGLYELAKECCKSGCSNEHRSYLWCLSLGIDLSLPEHSFHFNKLKSSVLKYHLLLDDLLIKDVKTTAANDVEYFVFEDTLHQVLLAFVRDSEINHFAEQGTCENFIPFKGFSMLVAPMCYLFHQTDKLYITFKTIYKRYFYMLHSITSNEKGIIGLCCLFETLLLSRNPELFQYIILLGTHPLRLVFPWLMSAFSGYLSVEQVLLLWDLIIGYDSLEILAVLAVAVIEFRARSLFQAVLINDVEAILSDLKNISILPLIQQVLFL